MERRNIVHIDEAVAITEELVSGVAALVAELSSSARAPDAAVVAAVVQSPASRLLIARDQDARIVGMLTLVLFTIPTGVRAMIEDVVVSSAARGTGVGTLLTQEALRLAGEAGSRTVDLSSRPHREAANRLYLRLGFEKRETNVYRFSDPAAR